MVLSKGRCSRRLEIDVVERDFGHRRGIKVDEELETHLRFSRRIVGKRMLQTYQV
jgi:hypothetical protein